METHTYTHKYVLEQTESLTFNVCHLFAFFYTKGL